MNFLETMNSALDTINGVIWADWVLYTVLGVGNRRGVWVQLAGSTLMVIGLMYAFYVKPVLVRRRQESSISRAQGVAA